MKKQIFALLIVLPLALGIASALSTPCINVPGAVGVATNVSLPYTVWEAPGFAGCEVGDKIFQNVQLLSQIPAGTTLNFSELNPTTYQVSFGGALQFDFSVAYDLVLDTNMNPPNTAGSAYKIVTVGVGAQAAAGVGSNFIVNKSLVDISTGQNYGTITATGVSTTGGDTVITGGVMNNLKTTGLHVTDTYIVTGGAATAIGNSFIQADTALPEPASLGLLGVGLIGLAALRRRKRA